MLPELESLADGVFLGRAPDRGAWHGGVPEPKASFTGVRAVRPKQTLKGEKTVITVTFESADDGISIDSFLFDRLLKMYPNGERALLRAATQHLKVWGPKLKADIIKYYKNPDFSGRMISTVFGWERTKDWEKPTDISVSSVRFSELKMIRSAIRAYWTAEIEFSTQEKSAGAAVFSAMSDKELNRWISGFEQSAPENFWMDGELQASRAQAYKMYRDQWRRMSARAQQEMLNSPAGLARGELRAYGLS